MFPFVATVTLARWLCVLLAVVSVESEIIYKKVGDKIVFKLDVISAITNIMWKDDQNIAVQWDQGMEPDYYRHFKDRGLLDTENGELTIKDLILSDSRLYTPEINNKLQGPIELAVIFPVPKPVASISCDDEKTSCILTCDGNTTDAEPATYRWKLGDTVKVESKEHLVTKNNSSNFKEFICELMNPVSLESSTPVRNPLYQPALKTTDLMGPTPNILTGIVVFVILLIAVFLVVGIHRCKAGVWFFQKTSMPCEADFWRKEGNLRHDGECGAATPGNKQAGEVTPLAGKQDDPQ